MNTSMNRKIRVLILQGEGTPGASPLGPSTEDVLRTEEPALEVTVRSARSGQAARVATTVRSDVILLDGVSDDPVEVVSELDEALGETPVLVMLDEIERDRVHACVVAGARGCLVRPVDADTLVSTIVHLHQKADRRRQLQADRPASA